MRKTPALLIACAVALSAAACAPGDDAAVDPAAAPDPNVGPVDLPPPVPAPEPVQPATVPAPFQGTFAADAAACDAPGDPSQLTIGSETITFHESTGPITAVETVGDDVTLTARLTGEGETRDATYRFGLSEDGNTLTDLDGAMTRVRCPEPDAEPATEGAA